MSKEEFFVLKKEDCPFCGGDRLREEEIWLCTDDGEELRDAVECLDCDAQAPAAIWNSRWPLRVVQRQVVGEESQPVLVSSMGGEVGE